MNTLVSGSKPENTDIQVFEPSLDIMGNDDHWSHGQYLISAIERVRVSDNLILVFESPRPESVTIGAGTIIPVRGICAHRHLAISKMVLTIGTHRWPLITGRRRPEVSAALSAAGFEVAGAAGFTGRMSLSSEVALELEGKKPVVEITLRSGQSVRHPLSSFLKNTIQAEDLPIDPQWRSGEADKVFICMATFEPNLDGFKRQIKSILAQDHKNWHMLVQDDHSSQASFDSIKEVCLTDSRITVRRNSVNQGFYHNFETALAAVPVSADYIALSDQDDNWYPQKISTLLAATGSDTTLIYSDMRILDSNDNVISDTYWRGRHNNFQNLDVLLIANTVTGAASLFRRDLVETLLPFPPKIGDAFHDHWIACAAFAKGPLAYVDRPLYDYYQHDASVVGYCDFETPAFKERSLKAVRAIFRRRQLSAVRSIFSARKRAAQAVFRFECRRIELICDTLLLRCPTLAETTARELRAYGEGVRSAFRLFRTHFSILRRGESTNDAELRLAAGYLFDAAERGWHIPSTFLRRCRSNVTRLLSSSGSARGAPH